MGIMLCPKPSQWIRYVAQISIATEKRLNSIQNTFLCWAFQTGPGLPLAYMAWDTEVLDMSIQIWVEKIMLNIPVRSLDESAIASKVYEKQKKGKFTRIGM